MVPTADDSRALARFAPALTLLALCIVINYVDRGNLSIAAPLLKDELRISASQLGILLSAFFWTYTAMQFVSGWLVDRFNVNLVIAAGYLLWSVATMTSGFVRGFAMFLVMRMLLGIGESVAFPSCSKLLAWHLPEHCRGFANGVIASGIRFGNAVGALGAGLLIAHYGWRPAFVGIGLASLLWLPAWARWKPSAPTASHVAAPAPGFREILRCRSFWGTSAGHFSINYLLYFMVTWLPYYLVHERHLSMSDMPRIASLYYIVEGLSSMAAGWLADAGIRRGGAPTLVRKVQMALGSVMAAGGMLGCATASPDAYVSWLVVTGIGSGMVGAGIFTFAQTLAGERGAAQWTGLQNGFANFAGVLVPALSGFVVDRTGSFLAPFVMVAAVLFAGGCAWVFLIGRVEKLSWAADSRPLLTGASEAATP